MLSAYFRLLTYCISVVLKVKGLQTQIRAYAADNRQMPLRPRNALSIRIKDRKHAGLLLGLHPRAKEKPQEVWGRSLLKDFQNLFKEEIAFHCPTEAGGKAENDG